MRNNELKDIRRIKKEEGLYCNLSKRSNCRLRNVNKNDLKSSKRIINKQFNMEIVV